MEGPDGADVQFLADHSVWIAVPAFAPAIVVAGVVVYIAMKNRRRGDADQEADERTP
ncbi:hypothetical protein MPHL43072_25060 [Mycolicibacterium phlei DSM 43072]|uniref:Uncharacterized protein n=2 Tax=Mycolicibacterium phlei TaxID=1771 RepID=A0A5N5UXZ5_MYCPH|nr:hypothetical protein MPHLEI_19494 [Mycolicibacterium phlei RIVM601174]KAB7754278.1 hypothetical protein MPHL21000_17005 [Mycolicibacterium phlei DSM 43239 = CCUG 21000]KXW64533.1 hypothetical protein MPHL43070_22470 [Mycolicibacterium phlei DSM 43070]KXW64955.1 hypothetical protein MPHL43072_25060 [Mycolicibacterium phlei DSM 43072]MBF4190403.1 hypothetical protein [Mycolicibacterium phlei]